MNELNGFNVKELLNIAESITEPPPEIKATISRNLRLIRARRVVIYFLRVYAKCTLKGIGRAVAEAIGKPKPYHHSTIIHHIKNHKDMLETEPITKIHQMKFTKILNLSGLM